MPVYEYECSVCGDRFETTQSIKDPPLTVCDHCGGRLERLISASSFVLKGGGWYKDLYSSSRKTSEKKSDGGGASKPEKASTDKAEPAATPKAGAK